MKNTVKRGKKGQRISELIGDEYKEWKPYWKYFISAPTGSGKTYFVLHVLLPYVVSQNKKMVYFVNRKILKDQLDKEISNFPYKYREAISVETYQSLEQRIINYGFGSVLYTYPDAIYDINNPNDPRFVTRNKYGYPVTVPACKFDFAICDECHYFLADSNYNKNTCLSYRFIMEYFNSSVTVFMSATIDDVRDIVTRTCENWAVFKTMYYQFPSVTANGHNIATKPAIRSYELPRDYSYVEVHIINKDDIASCILKDDKSKWLIFVDSITYGRELASKLKDAMKNSKDRGSDNDSNKEVIFLSSGYKNENESRNEVEKINSDKKFSAKVLISTSVMDNGIDIKDIELRNIIVIADTETEFVQMLGRKREDGKPLHLFLLRQDSNHFQRRLNNAQKVREFITPYIDDLIHDVERPLSESKFSDDYNKLEFEDIAKYHILVTQMVEANVNIDLITKVYMAYRGYFFLNMLAVHNIEIQRDYYSEVLESFDKEGGDAFLKRQMMWLGLSEEQIDEIMDSERLGALGRLQIKIDDKIGIPMDAEEAKKFKAELLTDLLSILDNLECENEDDEKEKKTVVNALKKPDRPISKPNMDYLREHCSLQYTVSSEKNNEGVTTYVFEKAGADVND